MTLRRLPLLLCLATAVACTDDLATGPEARAPRGPSVLAATLPDGDGDGIPDAVEPAEGTNPAVKDNDVFASSRLFVMQQYRDFLGREGDAGGIASWKGALDTGAGSRASVIEAFFLSPEFQNGGAPVIRLYFAYFSRTPDDEGLQYWLTQVRAGLPLEAISQNFAASTEFQDAYGSLSDGAFVDLVYQNVLGRAADPSGRAHWMDQLAQGLSRGGLMVAFSESDEHRARRHAAVYVTQTYVGMLRRVPDPSGFSFWTARLEGGASGQALIQGFLEALEYRDRFLRRGFSGSVRDLFGGPVAGLQVRVGTAMATTNGAGEFVTSLPPSGVQPVTVGGAGYITRSTYAGTGVNLPNPLTVVPASFDMASYDEVVRRNSGITLRWTAPPRIYVDTRPDSVAGGVPQAWINSTVAAAQSFPDQWTGNLMNPTVTVGTSPPPDWTANTIVIRFTDAVNPSGCYGVVGRAHFSWSGSYELRGAIVRLALGRLCSSADALVQAVVAHELGHAFGLGHSTLPGRASLMEPSIRLGSLSQLDHRNAALHYRRTPGHAAPDVETNLFAQRGIAPQAIGSEKREHFVCTAAL